MNILLIEHSPDGIFWANESKYRNEHNVSDHYHVVKNPNWQEADQLDIYKRDRETD